MPADSRFCDDREGHGRPRRQDDRRREHRTTLNPPPPLQLIAIEAEEITPALTGTGPGMSGDGDGDDVVTGVGLIPPGQQDGQRPLAIVHAADLALHSLGLLLPGGAPQLAEGMIIGLRWGMRDRVSWWSIVNVADLPNSQGRVTMPGAGFGQAAISTESTCFFNSPKPGTMRRVGCRRRNTSPETWNSPDNGPLEHNIVLTSQTSSPSRANVVERLGSRFARTRSRSALREGMPLPMVA